MPIAANGALHPLSLREPTAGGEAHPGGSYLPQAIEGEAKQSGEAVGPVVGSWTDRMTDSMICKVDPKKMYPRQRKVMTCSCSSARRAESGNERITLDRSLTPAQREAQRETEHHATSDPTARPVLATPPSGGGSIDWVHVDMLASPCWRPPIPSGGGRSVVAYVGLRGPLRSRK